MIRIGFWGPLYYTYNKEPSATRTLNPNIQKESSFNRVCDTIASPAGFASVTVAVADKTPLQGTSAQTPGVEPRSGPRRESETLFCFRNRVAFQFIL